MTRGLAALGLTAVVAAGQLPMRSFDRVTLLEDTGETSAGAFIGDLNGDGLMDIVLGKGRHWPLHNRVLLNDGRGGFTASNLGAAPDRTYSAALADLDRDGDLDVVVSNDAPDRKLVYLNDGQGRFTEHGTFGEPRWTTRYVTLADLNGDGAPDIIAANRGGNQSVPSFICWNDGTARFTTCDPLPAMSATAIVAADLDADGAVDLFMPHRDGGQSLILWNDGRGRFPQSTPTGPDRASARLGIAADFDGDGLPDLAVIEEAKRAAFTIANHGKRTFGEWIRLPGPARLPYAMAAGDLNRDDRADLVIGWVKEPGSVYYNTGTDTFADEVRWNDGAGAVYGMAFHDFNGDGWPDIVAARSDAPNGIWFSTPGPSGRTVPSGPIPR